MPDHVSIEERGDLALASVMARKGVSADAIGEALGIALADAATVSGTGPTMLLGTGPGTWLALHDRPDPGFADALAHKLAGIASVSDQSSGYVVFRVSGPGVRKLVQRGAGIDLHPDAFRAGSVATTLIAHIGVIVRQVDDAPTYDIAAFRSFAGSLRDWIDHAAAALPY